MSHFIDHYARLHDDELIDIALRRELEPDAANALKAELSRRGITNMAPHEAARAEYLVSEENSRAQQLARKAAISRWRSRLFYAVGLLLCLRGAYLVLTKGVVGQPEDGGFLIAFGVFLVCFGWITARFSRFWNEHVIHRKPPAL